jgi:hypothetical protein
MRYWNDASEVEIAQAPPWLLDLITAPRPHQEKAERRAAPETNPGGAWSPAPVDLSPSTPKSTPADCGQRVSGSRTDA